MPMNKLAGFFALRDSGLPSVKWRRFDEKKTVLDENLLWTARCATMTGQDHSLPRAVNVSADAARAFAIKESRRMGVGGMVVVYPAFTALVSGNLTVSARTASVEAVFEDLWRLADEGALDARATWEKGSWEIEKDNDEDPILEPMLLELLSASAARARSLWRDEVAEGETLLFEWSIAKEQGEEEPRFVFYELRSI